MAARGRPRPAITWWLGGRQIGRQLTDSNFKIRGLGAESELFVRPLAERYYAGYSCRATNAHGEHNVTLHLRTATVPGPVRQVQPSSLSILLSPFSILELETKFHKV